MPSSVKTIGWVGYGSMGRPMCANLLKAGFNVLAFDKNPATPAMMKEDGVIPASSAKDLAGKVDLVGSIIWNDDALRDVVMGANGVLDAMTPDKIFMDMSTLSPKVSEEVAVALAGRNIPYLRASVSGSAAVAKTAQLTVYASGPRQAYDRALPVLEALSVRQNYVGAGEEGRLLKLVINLLVAMSTATLGEALTFGQKMGLDRNLIMDAVNDSIVGSRHYAVRSDAIENRDLTSTGSWAGAKDVGMVMAVAREKGTLLPLASLVHEYVDMVAYRGVHVNGVTALAILNEEINAAIAIKRPASDARKS